MRIAGCSPSTSIRWNELAGAKIQSPAVTRTGVQQWHESIATGIRPVFGVVANAAEGMTGAAEPSDIDVDGWHNRAAHLPPGWLIAKFAREGGIWQGQRGGKTIQSIVFHVKAELRDGEDWDHFFNQRMTINGLAAGRSM
jgi:hypothetical protein